MQASWDICWRKKNSSFPNWIKNAFQTVLNRDYDAQIAN